MGIWGFCKRLAEMRGEVKKGGRRGERSEQIEGIDMGVERGGGWEEWPGGQVVLSLAPD